MYKKITTISGPVSLYIFIVDNKKYIFFGDSHFTNKGACEDNNMLCDHYDNEFKDTILYDTECSDFGALIHNWLIYNNDNDIKTDLYIETPFTKSNKRSSENYFNTNMSKKTSYFPYENESWLNLIADIMLPCFIRDKNKCQYYPNVHSHYIDVRVTEDEEGILNVDLFFLSNMNNYIMSNMDTVDKNTLIDMITDYWTFINILLNNYNLIFNLMMNANDYNDNLLELHELADNFINEGMKNTYFNILDNLEDMTVYRNDTKMYRIAAALMKLYQKNPDIAENIYTYIKKLTQNYLISVITLLTQQEINITNKKTFIKFMDYCADKLLSIATYHMDMYTLTRMFIQDESSEIILYAGDAHILNYVSFFENYLSNPKLIINNNNKSKCLSDFKIPIYINALTYKIYMYYRQKAVNILNMLENNNYIIDKLSDWRNTIIKKNKYIIDQLGDWRNIIIEKNTNYLFNTLYNIYYNINNIEYVISWDKIKTIKLIIKHLQLIDNVNF